MLFVKVECYLAEVRAVFPEEKYSIVLKGVDRLITAELSAEKHGKINPCFLEMAYTDENIQKDLLPSESVLVGDKVLLHLSYLQDKVIRWQKLSVHA